MGKRLQLLLVVCVGIFVALVVARLTGAIQLYEIPTSANEPGFKKSNKVFISNLKSPSKGDFITFVNPYSDTFFVFTNRTVPVAHYMYRFCAGENDTLKMEQGILYINNKNFDASLNLSHYYKVNKKNLSILWKLDPKVLPDVYNDFRVGDTATIVNLSDKVAKQAEPEAGMTLYSIPSDTTRFGVFKWNHNNCHHWSLDNFGPLIVPKGYCFVMGDNRSVALDSRYVGFIKVSNIKGTKL